MRAWAWLSGYGAARAGAGHHRPLPVSCQPAKSGGAAGPGLRRQPAGRLGPEASEDKDLGLNKAHSTKSMHSTKGMTAQ